VDTSFITPSLRMRALWLSLRSQLPALLEDICTCKATPIEEPPPAVPTSEGEGDAAAALLGLAREGLGPLPPQPALACLSCGTAAALVCSRCHVARYYNSACQRSHWVAVHSQECTAGPPPSPTPGTTVSRRNDACCSLLVVDRWALGLWLYSTVVRRYFYQHLWSTRHLEPGTVLALEHTPSKAFLNAACAWSQWLRPRVLIRLL